MTYPCGDATAFLTNHLTTYFTDVVGDVSLIADCLTAPTMASLTARIESILATAKHWEEDVGTEQEFKDIDWDWLTYDLTADDITDEFLETGLENMEEIQAIIDILLNDIHLQKERVLISGAYTGVLKHFCCCTASATQEVSSAVPERLLAPS